MVKSGVVDMVLIVVVEVVGRGETGKSVVELAR